MASILIIEDDRAIALGLRLNLRKNGHEVRISPDGETGLSMALQPEVDLVVLDVMLPLRNGYEVLKEMRRRGSTASVLMLTAKGMEGDKILGLKLGADDYLAKPFGLGELLARVEALLRRRPPAAEMKSAVFRFGAVEVDLDRQLVRRDGQPVEVSPQEFKVLRLFLQSGGRALSRDDILARCWGAEYEGTPRTVDNFVRSLRVKLEQNAEDPRHFLTVRGHGYRFEKGDAR
jgi:two-component system alkaline phosphatase synthesis response regulator PhoP